MLVLSYAVRMVIPTITSRTEGQQKSSMGCYPYTKISIDIRMVTRFAGENIFF